MLQMLKRFSSLVLVFMVAGSIFAGAAQLRSEHICNVPGMEMMPGMTVSSGEMSDMQMSVMDMSDMESMHDMDMSGIETMPCCEDQAGATTEEQSRTGECCVTIPQEPGSTGTTVNLRSPSFNIAITHPAVTQPPVFVPKPGTRPYVTQLYLPNLQASYIRNLSFLI